MTIVDGDTLLGVSAARLPTLRNCAIEAKRTGNTLDDPWAVKFFGFIVAIGAGASIGAGRREEIHQIDFSS